MTQPTLSRGLLLALAFLAAVGPFAVDMYLVTFTEIAADLGTSASSVQLTLTAFMLGLGLGQLFLGPLSDSRGRRPVMLGAMAVFAVSSIAMVFAPNIFVFIMLRAVQGLSGAAGVVVSRAIVVDLSSGAAAIRGISLLATMVGVAPLIAPPVGAAMLLFGDWRFVLGALATIATLMFVLVLVVVPETLPPERRRTGGVRATFSGFSVLLRSPRYLLLATGFAVGFAGMMSYVSASPFVSRVVLDMTPTLYVLGYVSGASTLIVANLCNAKLAGRVQPETMLRTGTLLLISGGALLTVLAATNALSILTFIASAMLLSAGAGLIMSNASALALTIAPEKGAGSALLGSTQFVMGALVSPLVGAWGEATALPMSLFVLAAGFVTFLVTIALQRTRPGL